MKRSSGFLPVLIAAVVSFASLFALAGGKHFGRQHQSHCLQQHCKAGADSSVRNK